MRASMSPLLVAACEGDVCTVQHLLCEAKGKSERALFEALELRDTLLRFTPLLACICGARVAGKASHAEVLRLLLDAGARAGCRDVAGYTPVHHCSFRLTSDTAVRLLPMIVAAGGDVNAKNRATRATLRSRDRTAPTAGLLHSTGVTRASPPAASLESCKEADVASSSTNSRSGYA